MYIMLYNTTYYFSHIQLTLIYTVQNCRFRVNQYWFYNNDFFCLFLFSLLEVPQQFHA